MKTELANEQEALFCRMLVDISHELRTPLANLLARIEAMEDGLWPSDPLHLEQCRNDVLRLARLVERIETLVREECSNSLDLSWFRLDQLIDRICSEQQVSFRMRGVALTWSCAPLLLHADERKIGTILCELLSNAVKYTPEGGVVEALGDTMLIDQQRVIKIQVLDTGCGIGPDELPHLFERFYRTDPSRNSATGGAGLGLSLCLCWVQQHGGTIEGRSRPEKGSAFQIILPHSPFKETML